MVIAGTTAPRRFTLMSPAHAAGYLAQVTARQIAYAAALDRLSGARMIRFDRGNDYCAVLHLDTDAATWRVTNFMPNMEPIGHVCHDSFEAAIREHYWMPAERVA